MSFLLLRGKMYHCTDCDLVVPIEYEGGPSLTQIGDMNVYEQMDLNEQVMPETYNPEKEGYYFHTGVLCRDCLPSHLNDDTIVYKKGDKTPFDRDYYTADIIPEAIIDVLEKGEIDYAKKFDAAYCLKVHQGHFDNTIGKKDFELSHKKQALADEYVKLARGSIIKDFKNFLFSSNQEVFKAVLESVDDGKTQCFLQVIYGATENLNPYICHDFTVRTQVKQDREYELYEGPYVIPKDKIYTFLKKGWFEHLYKKEMRFRLFEEIRMNIVGGL